MGKPWSPQRKAKDLRERAVALRLDAYYADGGVGRRSLTAGREACDLERQADELCPRLPLPAPNPVAIARKIAERGVPESLRAPGWAESWDAWEKYASEPVDG